MDPQNVGVRSGFEAYKKTHPYLATPVSGKRTAPCLPDGFSSGLDDVPGLLLRHALRDDGHCPMGRRKRRATRNQNEPKTEHPKTMQKEHWKWVG